MKHPLNYFSKICCNTPDFLLTEKITEEQARCAFVAGFSILYGESEDLLEICSWWSGCQGKLHAFPDDCAVYFCSPRALNYLST